jgi:hypothetical protein
MPQKGLAMKRQLATAKDNPCIDLEAINNLEGFIFPVD